MKVTSPKIRDKLDTILDPEMKSLKLKKKKPQIYSYYWIQKKMTVLSTHDIKDKGKLYHCCFCFLKDAINSSGKIHFC